MRVIAFWGGVVALVAAMSGGAALALPLVMESPPASVIVIIDRVGAIAVIALWVLLAAFFFGYAVTKRDA